MIEVLNVFEASYNTLHVSEAWTPLPKRFMSPFPLPLYSTFIDKVIWVCLPYRFGLCGSIMSRWRHLLGEKGFWHTVLSPKSRHQFAVFVFSVTLTSWKVDILRDAAPEIVMEGQRCHDNYFYWFWWYLSNWFKYQPMVCQDSKKIFCDSFCMAVTVIVNPFLCQAGVGGMVSSSMVLMQMHRHQLELEEVVLLH